MDSVDGSERYAHVSDEPPPSLLVIILDTSPLAWSRLASTLPLSRAIATLLVFINAHLAFNYANQVSVVASHSDRAQWLYPKPPHIQPPSQEHDAPGFTNGRKHTDLPSSTIPKTNGNAIAAVLHENANKYPPFHHIEHTLLATLRSLMDTTCAISLRHSTTMLAGALTLALSYINKQTLSASSNSPSTASNLNPTLAPQNPSNDPSIPAIALQSRILIISVSPDAANQYIPIMNCIFAAQRQRIPIDTLSLSSHPSVFLQQASDATLGTYLSPPTTLHTQGLLQYLLMAFLPDTTARRSLVGGGRVDVDFRAACFCHRKIVAIGWVCSICLSIFCEPLEAGICLTCGTKLKMGNYEMNPVVVVRKKTGGGEGRKKKRKAGGVVETPLAS